MPDTEKFWNGLSATTTQVLICDLQKQIVARSKTTKPEALSRSAGILAKIAKLFGLPVTLSIVPEGGKAPKLIPKLEEALGKAPQFPRATSTPFLARFATEVVVLQAIFDALSEGYKVLVAVDACAACPFAQ